MITNLDMQDQVERALAPEAGDFDVPAIVDQLQQEHGTVDIDDIPHDAFWEIVEKHQVI